MKADERLKKPDDIEANAFKSRKWDEITSGRQFTEADAPMLSILCHWHLIASQCIRETTNADGSAEITTTNKMADTKQASQIGTLEKATREIRALNKQLGINDTAKEQPKATNKANVLELVSNGKREVARTVRKAR